MDINQDLLKKYNHLVMPVIAIGISILVLAFVVIPNALKIPQTNDDIDSANSQISTLEEKIHDLDAVDVATYQNYIDTAYSAIPSDQNLPDLFGQLLYLLKSNNLVMTNISFPSPKQGAGTSVTNVTITIGIQGTGADTVAFIDNLKKSPRIVKVDNVQMTESKDSSALQTTMEIVTYFQNNLSLTPNLTQPVRQLSASDKSLLDTIQGYIDAFPKVNQGSATGPVGKTNPFQ